MINVKLIAETNANPTDLTSHAARVCYSAELPEFGERIDVENNLFKTGHHTTFQHNYFTFAIDGISVGAVTFGLHLSSPFYNTDQRSGRFSKMYSHPDFDEISAYIKEYWKLSDSVLNEVLTYIKFGTTVYSENIDTASETAKRFIKEERPYANDDYIKKNAPKIAQEQLRNFISIIAPTALDFTVNLSALAAMYRAAFTEELRIVTDKMKNEILHKYPDLAYVFDEASRVKNNYSPTQDFKKITIKTAPELKLLDAEIEEINYDYMEKDSVDLGYFHPKNMMNNMAYVKTENEMSIATMGQDQRHRSIKRSAPKFTGGFYFPPIVNALNLKDKAEEFMGKWQALKTKIPEDLFTSLAPYGAMVSYQKFADINALIHEQKKRTCWSAQEEIYWLSVLLRKEIESKFGSNCKLLKLLSPACYSDKCIEGRRYCGRDIKLLSEGNYFPKRKI